MKNHCHSLPRPSPPRSGHRHNCSSRCGELPLAGLLVFAALTLISCQSARPPQPVDIAQGDVCWHCKKPVAEKQYAAEFATKDGFVRKFDDLGCMIEHVRKMQKGTISAYFTVDYDKKQWMKAEDAAYVRSKRFKTPNDGGILAFNNRPRAESLASQYQAEVLTFNDLLK